MATANTERGRAKADRRAAIVREAARLFARDGFASVTIEQLGAAVGVSGPAVYRHFPGKQAILAELLVGVSRGLLDGGTAVLTQIDAGGGRLRALVDFHVGFAVSDPDVIRVQDRDLTELRSEDLTAVREAQRAYIRLWMVALEESLPDASRDELRLRVQSVFGLLNATPHSLSPARSLGETRLRETLSDLAMGALLA